MKNFRFKNIWLLSETEKRARTVEFSLKKTLVVGMNHTGKSSLIKSLFIALGATPTGDLDRWSKDAATLVSFSIDGVDYFVVRQHANRALFDADGKFLFAATNATDWGKRFASLSGYNLVLTDKNLNPVHGDARTFFLPFYINQDGSWLSSWDTFVGLPQYRQPFQSVLEFFTGVKPADYYELNAQKIIRKSALDDVRSEQRMLKTIKERFAKAVPLDGPKTIPEVFEKDVEALTLEMTLLNAEQEELKDSLVRQKETIDSLKLQVDLALHALTHFDRDAEYLRLDPNGTLTCPTCHAEHGKTFIEILKYTEDARVLRALVTDLRKDEQTAVAAYSKTRDNLRNLDAKYSQVSAILDVRRGDVKLGDIIASMGAETALVAFDAELEDLKTKIDGLLSEIDALDEKLDDLTNPERTKQILELFRTSYLEALTALNMPVVDTKRMKLTSRPDLSGSGGPRSILAYYVALWRTSLGEHGGYSVPAVIDSPQQQGQDSTNLPIMIEYIATKLPADMQVILAVETPTTFKFDKVVNLDEPYRLLTDSDFPTVSSFVRPFLDKMHTGLMRPATNATGGSAAP
ncbi:MAG: hypothetical protein ACJLUP_00805 [Agrobacterium tumefaciens]